VHFRLCCLAFLLVAALPAGPQQQSSVLQGRETAFARARHLQHGINASEWFAQSPNDYSAARTNRNIEPRDIALMAQLGFDNVRLSVDAAPLEQYPRGPTG